MKTGEQNILAGESRTQAHTPGPWKLIKNRFRIEVALPNQSSYAFSITDEANARLIAAAPELLAACKLALPYVSACIEEGDYEPDPATKDVKFMAAAIARAEGKEGT